MKKGQILIITLLVLTILSIITVTLIVLNNRDVRQIVVSEKYENIYNSSESKLQELVDKHNSKDTLNVLATTNGCPAPVNNAVNCNFNLTTSNPSITYISELKVSDDKNIDDYPILKDRPLELSLTGYTEFLDIIWTKDSALEFTLFYDADTNPSDSVVDVRIIKDVYDPTGLFDSTTNQFTYTIFDPTNPTHSVRIDLPNTSNLFFSITPRMQAGIESMEISITPSNPATFPVQVRKYTSKAYDPTDQVSPVVTLVSQIPLNAQTQGLFDYALNTQDIVEIRE